MGRELSSEKGVFTFLVGKELLSGLRASAFSVGRELPSGKGVLTFLVGKELSEKGTC